SVLFTENADRGESRLEDLLDALAPADIVIVEGYKREPIPKIEIFRTTPGKPPLYIEDSRIIAVATDEPSALLANAPPSLDLNDIDAIVDFVCNLSSAGAVAAAS
ncbi:MAG: molybdopterin-guanine dinucleotide biosynthesis protein MobB, partial [Pseudomonadota bacterium]|nr:molybdopterin-guanine dinucleotide biosynthesis protein MobB [Pseudomonadota bacterium]